MHFQERVFPAQTKANAKVVRHKYTWCLIGHTRKPTMLELRVADNECVSVGVWMREEQRGWQIG